MGRQFWLYFWRRNQLHLILGLQRRCRKDEMQALVNVWSEKKKAPTCTEWLQRKRRGGKGTHITYCTLLGTLGLHTPQAPHFIASIVQVVDLRVSSGYSILDWKVNALWVGWISLPKLSNCTCLQWSCDFQSCILTAFSTQRLAWGNTNHPWIHLIVSSGSSWRQGWFMLRPSRDVT